MRGTLEKTLCLFLRGETHKILYLNFFCHIKVKQCFTNYCRETKSEHGLIKFTVAIFALLFKTEML